MNKKWIISENKTKNLKEILLNNRSISDQDAFFQPHLYKLTKPEKFFEDLDKAIARIKKAIKNKELIYIYGDFDVDGITASAILWETIDSLGGRVLPFIPNREKDGYGIHTQALQSLKKEGTKLVISVDCGITALEEAKAAKKMGLDLVITDHHTPGEALPESFALLHTTKLAGSGVAFILASALLAEFSKSDDEQMFKNLELATIGTIADMVPLTQDNRIIVANGLVNLINSPRLGLKALYEEAGISKKAGTYEVGFMISPRLNAAGRLESALDSLRLLLTRKKEKARILAEKLSKINLERQNTLMQNLEHAKLQVGGQSGGKLLLVSNEVYNQGVIGLIASRLVETFYKPTVVISKLKPLSKGSARSIQNFHITQALKQAKDILPSFGGHTLAAGFSIEDKNIEKLKDILLNLAEKQLSTNDLIPKLKIDAQLAADQITNETFELIKKFEPFGIGNPEPVFMNKNLEIAQAKTVGKEGKHLKLILRDETSRIVNAIAFGFGDKNFRSGTKVDIAYNLVEDSWVGNGSLQLKIKDMRAADG